MQASTRVFFNTGALYIKLIITTIINLYLTRIVLDVLGIDDFGIYNLIAGVITLLAFLNGSLLSATQRFLSVGLGKGNAAELKKIFSISLLLHIILTVIIVAVLEILYPFLFDGMLNISADRINASKIVYQIMIVSIVFTIIGAPYNAAINAREDMWFFSAVEIVCTIIKLALIFILSKVQDALIFYTAWMLIVTIINFLIKYAWCLWKYEEVTNAVKIKYNKNKALIKEIASYIGWSSLSSFAVLGRTQGAAVVLNVFFTSVINGVLGIANQVRSLLDYFSQMMTTAVTPQIMKSKGENNIDRMLYLSVFACKMSFLLSAIISIPLLLNLPFVLNLWLKQVPEYTALFCQLSIYTFLVMQLYPGLVRGILADGRIKWYQITISVLLLLSLPISAILFYCGFMHYAILYVILFSQIVVMITTVFFANRLFSLNIKSFFLFIIKSALVYAAVYAVGLWLKQYITNEWVELFVSSIVTVSLFFVLYFIFVFDKKESNSIKELVKRICK
jgi:O-antigen/teichoic acid export membrane protein